MSGTYGNSNADSLRYRLISPPLDFGFYQASGLHCPDIVILTGGLSGAVVVFKSASAAPAFSAARRQCAFTMRRPINLGRPNRWPSIAGSSGTHVLRRSCWEKVCKPREARAEILRTIRPSTEGCAKDKLVIASLWGLRKEAGRGNVRRIPHAGDRHPPHRAGVILIGGPRPHLREDPRPTSDHPHELRAVRGGRRNRRARTEVHHDPDAEPDDVPQTLFVVTEPQ